MLQKVRVDTRFQKGFLMRDFYYAQMILLHMDESVRKFGYRMRYVPQVIFGQYDQERIYQEALDHEMPEALSNYCMAERKCEQRKRKASFLADNLLV